jgi:hypothetical protein
MDVGFLPLVSIIEKSNYLTDGTLFLRKKPKPKIFLVPLPAVHLAHRTWASSYSWKQVITVVDDFTFGSPLNYNKTVELFPTIIGNKIPE